MADDAHQADALRLRMSNYDVQALYRSLSELLDPITEKSGRWEFRFPRVVDEQIQGEVVLCLHGDELNESRRIAPNPSPDHIAEVESRALEMVSEGIREGKDLPSRDRVKFEEARLIGSFPRSRIVVLFRWARYPDFLCGKSVNIWNSQDFSYEYCEVKDFLMNIVLGLQNRNPELPEPVPDRRSGIAWV